MLYPPLPHPCLTVRLPLPLRPTLPVRVKSTAASLYIFPSLLCQSCPFRFLNNQTIFHLVEVFTCCLRRPVVSLPVSEGAASEVATGLAACAAWVHLLAVRLDFPLRASSETFANQILAYL